MNSISRLIVSATVAGLFAWLFADALFRSGMFAFRDAAHFYYPLFRFCADEWAAGRVPLWNPYENLGMPLAANAAASVFYPGKLIFALPISFAWAYKIYVMAHLLLAAGTAYGLARHWKAGVTAAGVCAISYAFSGNVLFQYCNVVFLVGAAWLPAAVLAADRMLTGGSGVRDQGAGVRGQESGVRGQGSGVRGQGSGVRSQESGVRGQESGVRGQGSGGSFRWAVAFGVVLALMTLGGDPQMAYNAGLLAALYALWLWWDGSSLSLRERVRVKRHVFPIGKNARPRWFTRSRLVLLTVAAVTGLVLSAVQVLPSMEFTAHSGRAAQRDLGSRLAGKTEPDTHSEHTYHFSVGPWRLAEYVWPNVGGRQFPVHRRWLDVIPAEGRIWTPSLYMGLLPLLLGLATMQFRRRKRQGDCLSPVETRVRWLSWATVLAVVAGFGWYGLGWLVREICDAAGGDPEALAVGPPFGGLYWLMTVVLPGYAYFRYPAKLLVVAALGLSVLAARGWDRVFDAPSERFRRGLLWLGVLSVGGALAALAVRPFWGDWLSGVRPDMLFGPLDSAGAADDLLTGFAQTAVLCGLFWWLLGIGNRGQVRFARWAALVLVAVDLGVANRWMVVCAPARQWEAPSKVAEVLVMESERSRKRSQPPFCRPFRVYRHPIWMRPRWELKGEATRLADAMRWDRDTLWPKYNLDYRIALAEVQGTMTLADYARTRKRGQNFFSPEAGPGDVESEAAKKSSDPFSLAKYALAKYVILPGDKVLSEGERIEVGVEDVSLWRNPRHLPRVWIADQVDGLPRAVAGDSCGVVHYDPLLVEIEAELVRPGLVVLCDQAFPGWEVEVAMLAHGKRGQSPFSTTSSGDARRGLAKKGTVPRAIVITHRVMRGVWLEPGTYRLTYRYRPASFFWGAIVSGVGWIGLVLAVGVCWIRSRRASGYRTLG